MVVGGSSGAASVGLPPRLRDTKQAEGEARSWNACTRSEGVLVLEARGRGRRGAGEEVVAVRSAPRGQRGDPKSQLHAPKMLNIYQINVSNVYAKC